MQDNSEKEDSKLPAVVPLEQQPLGGNRQESEQLVLPPAHDDDEEELPSQQDQPSSVHGEVDEDDVAVAARSSDVVVPPHQPELSMKERLVLRERERRIETERARLKRQFALSGATSNSELEETEQEEGGNFLHRARAADETNSAEEGTLGEESTRAHPDEESANEEARRLGFNMERFLRNSDSFNPQLEPMDENNAESSQVVMERFLSAPVVVSSAVVVEGDEKKNDEDQNQDTDVANRRPLPEQVGHRSVSFDIDGGLASEVDHLRGGEVVDVSHGTFGSIPSFGDGNASLGNVSNVSVQASSTADDSDAGMLPPSSIGGPLTSGASMEVHGVPTSINGDASSAAASDEPRVLRLTEADMQEMASIEEASIGNAPPSARGEEEILSEIGELADFGGGHHHVGGAYTALSQDTPTTAMESSSQISGNQSQRSAHVTASVVSSSIGHHDIENDQLPAADYSPDSDVGTVSSSIPAAVGSREEGNRDLPKDNVDGDSIRGRQVENQGPEEPGVQPLLEANVARVSGMSRDSCSDSSLKDLNGEGIVERDQGLVNRPRRHNPPGGHASPPQSDIMLTPTRNEAVVVDGFDFDKDAPQSPFLGSASGGHDSFRDLPADAWSPAGKMHVSPLHAADTRRIVAVENVAAMPETQIPEPPLNYGAIEEGNAPSLRLRNVPHPVLGPNVGRSSNEEETAPLLGVGGGDIPPEIVTRRTRSASLTDIGMVTGHNNRRVFKHLFSVVRSENEEEKEEVHNESEAYRASSMLMRAFPERQFALMVTFIFEIPVLLMITGGSDALCQLVGRSRYHLLIGFLPLTSAISGNVGLQASTLTTRAISHYHVTPDSYMPWFLTEVGAAAYLGLGMGLILATIAFIASGLDPAFAFTIFVAQFISIVTAGVTGTFAPLMFSFIFKRDSGKWGGPLETAIQDIVGSFAMVVISYRILLFLGTGEVDPDDACFGVAEAEG